MRILTIFCFFILLALSSQVHAQNTYIKKGDKLYLRGEYFAALENYKKAEAEGVVLDTRTLINKAICLYNQNDIESAFNIFVENEDKLVGEDIYYYAQTAHKFGFYDGAIISYEKAKKAGANPAAIDELIASCRWALANSKFDTTVKVNPETELYTGGQSFGIQFYKNSVVYSSADEKGSKRTVDKTGKAILGLYYSELGTDGKVLPGKKLFSKNLVFPEHVGAIAFTADNAMMYYSRVVRVKGGDSRVKIFSVEWDGTDWINETELPINSVTYSCAHPAVSPDNKFLYFTSDKPGGYGGKDLYVCERSKNGKLGEPKNLGSEINTFGDELYPFIAKDNTLYFSSSGRKGFGGLDIYSATLNGTKWSNIKNLMQPFNGNKEDFGYVIDPNNPSNAYLSSNRLGTGEFDAIFSVAMQPVDVVKIEPTAPLIEEPIDTTSAIVTPPVVAPIVAVAPAVVTSPVVTPPVVVAPVVTEPVITPTPPTTTLPKSISATIISTFNGTPISGVKVDVKDLTTNKVIGTVLTDKLGKFSLAIPEGSRVNGREFEIALSKGDEFNSKTMIVNIQELEDLTKNGLTLTPIFKDAVLDDISGMVIPYVGNQITPEGNKIIESLAAYLLKNKNIVIKLNGHTDARGDKLTNLRTSQTMAEKAESILIQKGVLDENIIPRSYGDRYIINKCKRGVVCDEASHLKNRRIDVVVWRILK